MKALFHTKDPEFKARNGQVVEMIKPLKAGMYDVRFPDGQILPVFKAELTSGKVVVIAGMEKPKSCEECPLKDKDRLPGACVFRRYYSLSVNDTPETQEFCRLVEVDIG